MAAHAGDQGTSVAENIQKSLNNEPPLDYQPKFAGMMVTIGQSGGVGSMNGMSPQVAMGQAMPQPWVVLEQMRQTLEVQDLGTDTESIPDEIDVLMLVHPKGLSDRTLYAIDQFVLGGGRALVFVDPLAEAEQAAMTGKEDNSLSLRASVGL